MFLDETTATNLGWTEVLDLLSAEAVTPQGRAHCRGIKPLAQSEEIQRAQERCRQLSFLLDRGTSPPIESIDEVADELERARKQGVLSSEAVQSAGRAMLVSSRVRGFLIEDGHTAGGALTDLARGTHDLSSAGRDLISPACCWS